MFLPALALTYREQESRVRTIWDLGLCSPECEPGSVHESPCPSHVPGRSPRDARGSLTQALFLHLGRGGKSRPSSDRCTLYKVPWDSPWGGLARGQPPTRQALLLPADAVLRNHCGSRVNQLPPSPPLTHFQMGPGRKEGGEERAGRRARWGRSSGGRWEPKEEGGKP